MTPSIRLIPLPTVEAMTGLRRSALYDLARAGKFPQPRKVTERATRWVESEVAEWCATRPTGTLPSPNPYAAVYAA
jgi:prophage regulatory protein